MHDSMEKRLAYNPEVSTNMMGLERSKQSDLRSVIQDMMQINNTLRLFTPEITPAKRCILTSHKTSDSDLDGVLRVAKSMSEMSHHLKEKNISK